jgi:hypothetical protein
MNNGNLNGRLVRLEELAGLPDQKLVILSRILWDEPVAEDERRFAFDGPPKGPLEEWLRALVKAK